MKKISEKGFTIVELVIVIAVIAIIVSVVIPGFTEIIARANLDKDITLCANLNKTLATSYPAGKLGSVEEVMNFILEEGYSIDDFKPSSKNYYYVYDYKNNRIALINQNFEIKYKDNDLSDDLWILVESEDQANEILSKNIGKCEFLLIESDAIRHIVIGGEVFIADENNIQEVINMLTSVDSVVKFIMKGDCIENNIVITKSNALTLDLCGKEIDGLVFKDSIIENYGELKIINGNLTNKDSACIIENNGKLFLDNVNLQSSGTNSNDATIINYGTLSLKECNIFSTGTSCIKNEVNGTLVVSSGRYESDCGSNILNFGIATIDGGEFVRNSNNILTGTTGSAYAVISNVSNTTIAKILINNGNFINKYLTIPSGRILSVVYNQGGEIEINGGEFENMCNSPQGYVLYARNRNTKVNLTGGEYISSNLNTVAINCVSVNKSNIIISDIVIRGAEKSNLDGYVVKNKYVFYNYLNGSIPRIELTDKEPSSYGARVNDSFYLDVNFITLDMFDVGTFAVINEIPENFKIILDRTFLGTEKAISLVYGKEMDEIVSVAEDYVLQKTDIKSNYPGSFSAFKYYSHITSETATFKAEYSDGSVNYFSFAEWDLACKNTVKLTLLKDITTNSSIGIVCNPTGDITFDLNGKTWTESGSVNYMLSVPRNIYTFTIIDSSTSKTGSMVFDGKDTAYGLLYLGGSIVVEGGNFKSNGNVLYMAGSDEDKDSDYSGYTYTVEGGIFMGQIYQNQSLYHGKYVFRGGVFSVDPSAYLEESYAVSINSEGLYLVNSMTISSSYKDIDLEMTCICELRFLSEKGCYI